MRKSRIRYMAILLVLILVVGSISGCSSNNKKDDDNKDKKGDITNDLERVILTIDDKDYTLQDIMYMLYTVESDAATEIYYTKMFGGDESSYWDEKDDVTGKTVRELTKDSVIDVAEMIILLEQQAKEEGYTLNEDELAEVDDDVASALEAMNGKDDYLKRTGFTTENLTELVKQYNLATKYYTDQAAKIQVDQNSIKEIVSPEDYAQVEVEYMLFSTGAYDDQGNYTVYEPEMVSQILKNAQAAYQEIADGADFSSTGKKYESEDPLVEVGTMPLYNNAEDNEESLYNAFKDLKNGDLYSGVVEVTDGYYIIRMVNDNCTEAYDQAVEEELTNAQASAYEEQFKTILAKHTVSINEENWALIEIGNYAFPPIENDEDGNFDYDEDNDGFDIPASPGEDGAVG